MNFEHYASLLDRFAGRRLIVLGDLMMDEYLWGRTSRISPEAPVMVVDVARESSVPGGAANVVNNLLSLGAKVAVIGIVGDDRAGRALVAALADNGADVSGIVVDPTRPTTRKTRVLAHHQQVLRIDREQTEPIGDALAETLQAHLERELADAETLVVSEYNKGLFTPALAEKTRELTRRAGVLLTSNPKPPNARLLAGAKLVSLNQGEASAILSDPRFSFSAETVSATDDFAGREPLEAAGEAVRRELNVEALVVTYSAKGMSVFHRDYGARHIPPHLVEVYDAAGAGDTVISTISLALTVGATEVEAACLAATAAACAVRKVGVATVSVSEIRQELESYTGRG